MIHTVKGFDYAKAFDCVDHNKLWTILKVLAVMLRTGGEERS